MKIKVFMLLFFAGLFILAAQENNPEEEFTDSFTRRNIDPRQYVEVYMIDKLDKKIPIWKYSRDQSKPNQIRNILEATSKIQIEFDKSGIAENHYFKGNISIEGKIVSSKGGEDPVEVYPYSRIGEEKRKIGITSRPPSEIANIFTNLLIESLEVGQLSEVSNIQDLEKANLVGDLRSIVRDLSLLDPNKSHFGGITNDSESTDNLYNRLGYLLNSFKDIGISEASIPSSLYAAMKKSNILNGVLSEDIQNFIPVIEGHFDLISYSEAQEFPKKLNYLNSQIKVAIDYINYFKSSGEKAEDAFLSFINLDHIGLDNIEANLKAFNAEIDSFFKSQDPNAVISTNQGILIRDLSNIDISNEIQSTYIDAIAEMAKLTQLRGTLIERLLFPDGSYLIRDNNRATKFLEALIPKRSNIVESLAQQASEIIYLNLDYATINLQKERAQEGDYLYIYVVLEETSRRSAGGETEIVQKVLPIGSYELRDTRWKVKVSDSFLLIDRINQPNTSDNEDVSPSNYKGAPGVSLLLTRRNDGSDRNKLVNFLEPSIGINVSYVDFSRNDDVEIGAGLILGLFNNKVFFTGGLNLNSTGQDETDPYYFGIGFSFANLASKLLKDK